MRVAREAISTTQAGFCEKFGGGSVRSYQKNESGSNEGGICLAAAFVRAGFNANWLLTGEGPMRLGELSTQAQQKPAYEQINLGALAALLQGAVGLVKEGMPVERAARLAAETYQRALEAGEITPTGIGEGRHGKVA